MEQRFTAVIAEQQKIIEAQAEIIKKQAAQLEQQDATVRTLQAQVKQLSRTLYGRKSEKIKIPPVERDVEPPDEDELLRRKEEAERKRRERALARTAALATEDVPCPLREEDRHCPHCDGTQFKSMPPETSHTIEYRPGRFIRRRHLREKAACTCGGYIVTAPPPPKLIARGQYGPGFAAYLVVAKCVDSLPIYRIEKRMQRLGIPLSRSTMNDVLHSAAEVTAPLAQRIKERMAGIEIVLADETTARLQDRKKRGYTWVFHGHDGGSGGQLVLYVFTLDRSSKTPKDVLGESEGALVVDGYTGYNIVEDPELRRRAGCWCHARRKFFEAQSTAPDETAHVIAEMRKLFRVEHQAKVRDIVGTAEHLALRTTASKPVVDKLFAWLAETKGKALPKGPLAQAIGYMLNQQPRLQLFLTDPRIPLHNNSSEERLRVIALGRKNYLFFGHPRAGRNFAGLYSLVGSCIANGVEPTAYLTDVLTRVGRAETDDELDALLPDRWTPPL